jgi:hypothetical protein
LIIGPFQQKLKYRIYTENTNQEIRPAVSRAVSMLKCNKLTLIFIGIRMISDAVVSVNLEQVSIFQLDKPFNKKRNKLLCLSILHNWGKSLKEGERGCLLTKRRAKSLFSVLHAHGKAI